MSTDTQGNGSSSTTTASRKESTNGVQINNASSKSTNETPSQSRRPADVALLQQRMKSWQPLLDPKWVIASYLVIGIIFIPIGESILRCQFRCFF